MRTPQGHVLMVAVGLFFGNLGVAVESYREIRRFVNMENKPLTVVFHFESPLAIPYDPDLSAAERNELFHRNNFAWAKVPASTKQAHGNATLEFDVVRNTAISLRTDKPAEFDFRTNPDRLRTSGTFPPRTAQQIAERSSCIADCNQRIRDMRKSVRNYRHARWCKKVECVLLLPTIHYPDPTPAF